MVSSQQLVLGVFFLLYNSLLSISTAEMPAKIITDAARGRFGYVHKIEAVPPGQKTEKLFVDIGAAFLETALVSDP